MTKEITLEQGMPASVEAERTILGAILLDNRAYDQAAELEDEFDWALNSHRVLISTISQMIKSGAQVDIVTLSDELARQKQLEAIGNRAYLFSLTENLPRRLSITDYVRIVKEKSHLRQILGIANELTLRASDQAEPAANILQAAREALEQIAAGGAGDEDTLVKNYAMEVADLWEAQRNSKEETGLSYGIEGLNRGTGGMRKGENTTVGGMPGSGKSSVAMQALVANCSVGIPGYFVSLEMTRQQCLYRIYSMISGVPANKLRNPRLANLQDAHQVRLAARLVSEWPMHIYDKSRIGLAQLSGVLRFAIRKHKIRLFAVDFAQLIAGSGKDLREKVSSAVAEMTAIAKGEGVSLLLLSQLARMGREGFNRRPRLQDLKESGTIEESAHCVALIHHPWDEENGRNIDTPATTDAEGCEIIIAKQREGPTYAFPVAYDSKTLKFVG